MSAATGDRMLKDAIDRWNDSKRNDDFVLRGAARGGAVGAGGVRRYRGWSESRALR